MNNLEMLLMVLIQGFLLLYAYLGVVEFRGLFPEYKSAVLKIQNAEEVSLGDYAKSRVMEHVLQINLAHAVSAVILFVGLAILLIIEVHGYTLNLSFLSAFAIDMIWLLSAVLVFVFTFLYYQCKPLMLSYLEKFMIAPIGQRDQLLMKAKRVMQFQLLLVYLFTPCLMIAFTYVFVG